MFDSVYEVEITSTETIDRCRTRRSSMYFISRASGSHADLLKLNQLHEVRLMLARRSLVERSFMTRPAALTSKLKTEATVSPHLSE